MLLLDSLTAWEHSCSPCEAQSLSTVGVGIKETALLEYSGQTAKIKNPAVRTWLRLCWSAGQGVERDESTSRMELKRVLRR